MKKRKTSLQGKIISKLIEDVTSTHIIGKRIKNGEFLAYQWEPKWKCPDTFQLEYITMEHFTMELLTPKFHRNGRAILQLHGGGYIGKLKNIYRDFAVFYSRVSRGSSVLTIDYRVAPKDPYPAALMDAVDAYHHLLNLGFTQENIVIAGDSAGGGLSLALCLYLRDQGLTLPKGIITMSAWTDLTGEGETYTTNYEVDALFGNTKDSMIFNKSYVGDSDARNPYISPVFGDFTGFPPMLMQVGDKEMLLSDTLTVANLAKERQIPVRVSVYAGMFHVFQMAKFLIPESKRAWKEVAHFFHQLYTIEQKEKEL